MTWNHTALRTLSPILLALSCLCGCGKQEDQPPSPLSGILKGKVTLDGQPVMIGWIIAVSEDGRTRELGVVQVNGDYVIDKVPIGKVSLCFAMPKNATNPRDKNGGPGQIIPPEDAGKGFSSHPDERKSLGKKKIERLKSIQDVPARYLDAAQSGLAAVISEGENHYDIQMTRP